MTDLDKLKMMTAWDTEPTLTATELDDLLAAAARSDDAGLSPDDVGWEPTYDLNAAAADGWLIKAGKASATVEVDPPGSGIYTSQVFENCRMMARSYAAKRCSSVRLHAAGAL